MLGIRKIFMAVLILVTTLFLTACITDKVAPEVSENSAKSSLVESPSVVEPPQVPEDGDNAAGVLNGIYAKPEDSGDALAALESAGIEDMDDESRLVYAVLLRNEGRLDDSRDQLEQLIGDSPSSAAAWFNLALVEYAAGNEQARDEALDAAIEADDTMVDAYALKGNLAIAASDWKSAESNFKRALELEPESAESLVGLAWVMAKTERLDRALPLLDRAVEAAPDFVYARVDRSRVNVALNHYNDAEDDLSYVIELEPDVPWHYLDRARIRLRDFKDYEGAREDLETVERLDPDNFFALVYLAGLHDEERRFALSRSYYKRVVDMRPDYVWAYMPLGKFAWMAGDYESAAKWFEKASVEDSGEFSLTLMTAFSLLRAGNPREANKMFSETLRRFEQGETAYEVVRFCMERSSDFYAINALNKESNETLRERLWYYMGAMYEIEGNQAGSRAVFNRIAQRQGSMEYDLAYASLNGMGD